MASTISISSSPFPRRGPPGAPLATKLLLESLLAPFLLAGFVMLSARALRWDRAGLWAPALAITLALSATFIFAFGWPSGLILSARMKVMLSAVIGFAIGVAVEQRGWFSRPILIAGTSSLALWVGFPALQQGRPALALAILPITLILAAPLLVGRNGSSGSSSGRMSLLLMTLAAALGVTAIAAFAKSFSFAQLSAALASAILAILMVERTPPSSTTLAIIAAILLTLLTALLLYTEASLAALIMLGTVIGAEHLPWISRANQNRDATHVPVLRVLFYSLLSLVAAVLIARIDAGPISIY